jgi:hypothetical protein
MKKYGFVYIWFDRKHKRFYIGCRWGKENDGYICSSPWMKQGFKHRPDDFKRRILKRVYTDKKDLLEEEYKWLSKIKKDELGKRYYNLHNHHFGHWSTDDNRKKSVGQKISESHKNDPNWGKWNKGKSLSEECKEKLSVSVSKTMTPEHRALLSVKCSGWKHTDEAKEKIRQSGIGRVFSEESKIKIGAAQKGKIVSEETREKLRNAVLGKKRGPYKKREIIL